MNTLTLPAPQETAKECTGALRRRGESTPGRAVCFFIPQCDITRFGQLSEPVRDGVMEKLGAMKRLSTYKSISAGCRELELTCGLDADSLRRLWCQFKADGWRALVDCAREGCTRESLWESESHCPSVKLSKEFTDWFLALAEKNQRATRPAFRVFRKMWMSGQHVPGLDNKLPRHCLPPGCSEGNLYRYCQEKFGLKAMRQGLGFAIAKHGPKTFTTRHGLWPMSHVMIDDLWHDNFVLFKGQIVRVLEFDALEVLSGCKIGWGTQPRVKREDGTMDGLKEKYVRLLLAQIFFQHGFSPRGTTILAEHGTAAVPEWLAKLLHDRTGGKIITRESGITGVEQAVAGMFRGQGKGNPRFKSMLESLRNLIHNELAALPAQTGKDRNTLPEQTHGELKHADDLLKAIAVLAETNPERAELIQLHVLQYHSQFLPLLSDVYETINCRDWHELEGWHKCGFVVPQLNDGGKWACPESLVPAKREALIQLAQIDKGYARDYRLSPRQVFNRGRETLTKIPAFVVAEILGNDFARETPCRNGYFQFEDEALDPEVMIFEGRVTDPEGNERELPSDTYQVFVNPFDLNQLFVHDARGRHIGIARRVIKSSKADLDGIHAQFGRNNKRLADLLKPIRERHADITREASKRAKHNADVIGENLPEDRKRRRQIKNFKGEASELLDGREDSTLSTPEACAPHSDDFSADALL
jgi:hypothetical protein